VTWIVGAAWAGAVVFAAVVLAFCGYEIRWKSARLRSDLERLLETRTEALELGGRLQSAAERLARARSH
jgi:hypothetical protein